MPLTLAATPYQSVYLRAGSIRYRVTGEGPVLVFVHGLFMNGGLWRMVVDDLSDRFRCIVPEWPLGAHDVPMRADADLSPPGVATIITDFLEALDLRDVTLVASDTGGALCQIAISRRPASVTHLVLTNCDSYECFFPPSLRGFQVLPRIPGFTWLLAQMLRPAIVRHVFAMSVATNVPGKPELDALFAPMLRNADVRRDLRKFCIAVSNAQTLEAAKSFAGFTRPVLVVWGKNDLFFPQSHGKRLAESFPNARLEWLDDCRTLVPEDQPARLGALIAEFVGTHVTQPQPA